MGRYLTPQYPVCFINKSLLEYLGYKDEKEFLNDIQTYAVNCIHPDDCRAVEKKIAEQLAKEDNFAIVYRMKKRDGTYIWISDKGQKMLAEDGAWLIVSVCLDITEQYELQAKLNSQERLYNIALNKSNINVWEYDLIKRCLFQSASFDLQGSLSASIIENMPDSLLQQGYIHPASVKDYLELNNKLFSGEKSAVADLRFLHKEKNEWHWERVACTNIFDEFGSPVKAVVVSEDITQQKSAEIKYQQELQVSQAIQEGMLISYRFNFTQGKIEFLKDDDSNQLTLASDMTYSMLLEAEAQKIVNGDDRERYLQIFAYDNLLKNYSQGKNRINLEYRRTIEQGKIIWVNAVVNLLKDAITGELYLYSYIRNIDEQKNIELALKQRAEKDELTGAYNKETALIMMRDALNKSLRFKDSFALLIFNVDNFRDMVSKSGYIIAEDVLKNLSDKIHLNFGSKKIVGKFYSDEFVIFTCDNPEISSLKKSVEKIKKIIAMPYMFNRVKIPISVSVGIALGGHKKVDLDWLYDRARVALGVAKAEGKNKCVIYSEEMQRLNEIKDLNSDTNCFADDRDIQGMILQLAFSLVSCTDFTAAMNKILHEIAEFYGAKGAYIFALDTNSEISGYQQEWEKVGIAMTEDFNLILSDFLLRYTTNNNNQQERIIIDTTDLQKEYLETYNFLLNKGISSLCLFPLKDNEEVIGYLGVNNLTCNQENMILLDRICYFIVNEIVKRQMQIKHEYLSYHDNLTGLFNRNSYLQYLEEITEETLISLGVVLGDINGLKQINMQYGHLYGDQVIISVARIMKKEFKMDLVYRFSSDEFLIICQNITKELFESKVKKVKEQLENAYPGWIAVGFAWSDSDILLDRLIIHADEKMMIAKNEYYNSTDNFIRYHDSDMLKRLLFYLSRNYFKLYLQPKAIIKAGEVSGAEALVRLIHPKYGLVTPDKFIPQLEKNGIVSYIDFFMFEEVCKTLKKWIEQGVNPITISFNFSRSTILSDNLIIKMMQIYDKYQVPKELIEIEITESMGEIERETIAQIGFQIVEQGFRLSLDDFGAKYSNISVLSAMRLHVLKLDKSLVNDLFSNKNTRIIVKNFLLTCRELGIKSVAEGVETAEQLAVLKELDCDFAQGYYFNKPIPLFDFEQKYLYKS